MAQRSGIGWLVVLGLVALGFAGAGDGFGGGDADTEAQAAGADDDFSFEPESGTASDDDSILDGADCDGVVVVQVAEASAEVPGETGIFQDESVSCVLTEGDEGDAVVALQDALVRCNGQSVPVDGDYGPATAQAVANVQAANGLATDGTFGDATRRAMTWPAETSGGVTCVDTG